MCEALLLGSGDGSVGKTVLSLHPCSQGEQTTISRALKKPKISFKDQAKILTFRDLPLSLRGEEGSLLPDISTFCIHLVRYVSETTSY